MRCEKADSNLRLQLTPGSTGRLCGPSTVITFDHAYIPSYIIALFTIMRPTTGLESVLQRFAGLPRKRRASLHEPAGLSRMQNLA